MMQLATQTQDVQSIEATLNYVKNDGQKIVVEPVGGGSTEMRTVGTLDPHSVAIRNGRKFETSLDGDVYRPGDGFGGELDAQQVGIGSGHLELEAGHRVRGQPDDAVDIGAARGDSPRDSGDGFWS